ncbi:MAG: two-component system cell cycle sensor histidine kinase/response regulator CckA [Desulforhopalus sp.]|jgi:two-component system cell cycle sensor histidine kinase/response regulator CckA
MNSVLKQRQRKYVFPLIHLTIITLIFILLPLSYISSAFSEDSKNKSIPQVLIVHSAYQGYPWTDSLNRGIAEVFGNAQESVGLIYEYLDTKRNNEESYFIKLHKLWEQKYQKRRIDLILVCDNQAYDFIIKGRDTLFNNTPIIFAAYIGFRPEMLENEENITGVIQETDVAQTIDIALKLHPKTQKIIFVAPGAPKWRMRWLDGLPEKYSGVVAIETITDKHLSLVESRLKLLGPDVVVIPLNSVAYADDTYMPFDQFVLHLSSYEIFPVYALWDIALKQGVVGGKMVSGERQGREAAKLALKFINGTPITSLPVVDKSPNQYMFNYKQLQRFDINIEALPADSYVINRPSSFYLENKNLVRVTVCSIVILVLLVISLLIAIAHLGRAKNTLLLSDEILKQMPDALVLTDPQGKITRWLGNAKQILGYSEDESKGRTIDFLKSHNQILLDKQQLTDSIFDKGHFTGEILCQRKDGSVIPTDVHATHIVGEGSVVLAHIWIVKDISNRKSAEHALKESQSRFAKMIEKSPLPMVIIDKNQNIEFFNDKFTELFGYTTNDIITAEDWWNAAYPDPEYAEQVKNSWVAAIVEAAKNNSDIEMQEWDITIKDRTRRRCEFYMVPLDDVSLIIMNDITERKETEAEKDKLESRLQQAQKMEAIGALAGGIAHDFNNLLSAILGFTEMAKDACEPESNISKDLHEVLEAGNRARDLVQQILAFSRKDDAESFILQPATIVSDVIKILRPSLPTTIDISQDIERHIGLIVANPTQVHQILMNLCTNAFHAMERSGGKLHISLKEVVLGEDDLIHVPEVATGRFIQFKIQDSGHGIDPGIKDKIFDPYFTTKETGKGTGMGLSIVHGIVKNNGGFISVASKLGVGTTVQVYWPVIESNAQPDAIPTDESIPRGTERILFVDDEEILSKMAKSMLEGLGYMVTVENSSVDALLLFQETPYDFDLVITDQTMPGMTGGDMSRKMIEIRPDIPIILCTGYSTIISEDKAKTIGVKEFALKPLTKHDISTLIRKVLDNTGEPQAST